MIQSVFLAQKAGDGHGKMGASHRGRLLFKSSVPSEGEQANSDEVGRQLLKKWGTLQPLTSFGGVQRRAIPQISTPRKLI